MKSKTVNIFGSNSTDNINTTCLALNLNHKHTIVLKFAAM